MAGVSITAVQEGTYIASDGNRAATLRIVYSGDVNVRAFGLDLNVDSGTTFKNIRDFNVGENKYANASSPIGYGIFPGRFRTYVNPINPDPCYALPDYNPTPPYNDPGSANTGIGYGTLIAELGYLGAQTMVGGVDVNMPAKSGTLFRIDVNSYGKADANLTIALDTMRGGVVDANTTNAAATNLPVTSKVVFGIPTPPCTTPTNEVGAAKATAESVWTGQNFTLSGTSVVDCAHVGLIISQDTACVTTPAPIHYTYGIQATVPNVVNALLADANTAIIGAHLTVGPITYTCSATIAAGHVISSTPVSGTSYCGSVAMVVSTGTCDCLYVGRVFDPNTAGFTGLTVTTTQYNLWVTLGKPNCWCCTSQKRGNGVYTGSTATKTDSLDLAAVKNVANYGKTDTSANACLDFNLSGKIDSVDLARVKNVANWGKVTGQGPPCN
jgi:hypothetical protein